MRTVGAIFLLLIATLLPAQNLNAQAFFKTGNQLLKDCEDKDIGIACSAYIIGVIDAEPAINGNGKSESVLVCLPKSGFTARQAERVAIKFMNENPDKLHMPAPLVLVFAFMEAFPCPKAKG